jgi:transcriptional regulator with XRE-family HTH domain
LNPWLVAFTGFVAGALAFAAIAVGVARWARVSRTVDRKGALSPSMTTSAHSSFPPRRRRTLGEALRSAREAARLTLKELGAALELAPSYLSDLENNRRPVSRKACDQLSATLGMDRTLLYARAGHLSEGVLEYLAQTPRALAVLERLAARRAGDELVGELLGWIEERAGQQTADGGLPATGSRLPESEAERKES